MNFDSGPKILMAIGALLFTVGGLWLAFGKFIPFGKLPGDIAVERENFKFYFPLGTSILLSVGLSLILFLFNYFKNR